MNQYRYLVLGGGGVNGALHLGALRYLEAYLPSITGHFWGIGGVSIGALLSTMVVLGYSVAELQTFLQEFQPHFAKLKLNIRNLAMTRSLYGGALLHRVVESAIQRKLQRADITFSELNEHCPIDLRIVTTELDTCTTQVFSALKTPFFSVASAVVASMSIPGFFPPLEINKRTYIDGGTTNNLPHFIFDAPSDTLSIWLRVRAGLMEDNGFIAFYKQLIKCLLWAQDDILSRTVLQQHPCNILQLTPRAMSIDFGHDITKSVDKGILGMFLHMWRYSGLGARCRLCQALVHALQPDLATMIRIVESTSLCNAQRLTGGSGQ